MTRSDIQLIDGEVRDVLHLVAHGQDVPEAAAAE
jgi:sigma54-dependent transcription regulator